MSRAFWIPGVVLLLAATVLNFLVAIGESAPLLYCLANALKFAPQCHLGLPFLTAIDVTRVHFAGTASSQNGQPAINQLRVRFRRPC
jgi:hypothetical protein